MDTNTTNDEANGDKKKKITFRLADPNTGEISSNERVYSGDLKVENGASNIQIGNNLILDIGRIEWNKPEYHSDRYIYPIGYKAQRHYASYMHPDERVVYTCEILEGEKGPLFRVTPSDDPETTFEGNTPTGCWSAIIKRVNESQGGKRVFTTVSGPEYFGLSNPKVRALIESLPNADKCERYDKKVDSETTPKKKRGRPAKVKVEEASQASEEDAEFDESQELGTGRPKRKRQTRRSSMKEDDDEDGDFAPDDQPKKKKQKTKSKKGEDEDDVLSEEQRKAIVSQFKPPNSYPGIETGPLPELRTYQFRCYDWDVPVYNGNEKTAEIYRELEEDSQRGNNPFFTTHYSQNSQAEDMLEDEDNLQPEVATSQTAQARDKEADRETLRSMWEFAFICYSCKILRPVLKFTEFSAQDLEEAFVNPQFSNFLLADIHIKLIKGPAIDRKNLSYIDHSNSWWKSILKNKLQVLPNKYAFWRYNPMLSKSYNDLPPAWRAIILRALLEWKMDTNQRVIDYVRTLVRDERTKDDNNTNPLLIQPLGTADSGDVYWYFGEEVGRLFLETPAQKGGDGKGKDVSYDSEGKPVSEGKWQVICTTTEEFEAFINEFQHTEGVEGRIAEWLADNALPNIRAYAWELEREREKQRKEMEEREAELKKQQEEERLEKEKKEREKKAMEERLARMAPPPLPAPTLFSSMTSLMGLNPQMMKQMPQRPVFTSPINLINPTTNNTVDNYLASPTQTKQAPEAASPSTPAQSTRSGRRTRSGRAVKTKSYFEVEHALDDEEGEEKDEETPPSSKSRKKKAKKTDDDDEEADKDDEYHEEEKEEKDDDDDFTIEDDEDEDDDEEYENMEEEEDDEEYEDTRRKKKGSSSGARPRGKGAVPHASMMSGGVPTHMQLMQMLHNQQQQHRNNMAANSMMGGGMHIQPPQPQVFQWSNFNPSSNFVQPQQQQQQPQQTMNHPLIQQLSTNGPNQGVRPMQMFSMGGHAGMQRIVQPPPMPVLQTQNNLQNMQNSQFIINPSSLGRPQQPQSMQQLLNQPHPLQQQLQQQQLQQQLQQQILMQQQQLQQQQMLLNQPHQDDSNSQTDNSDLSEYFK